MYCPHCGLQSGPGAASRCACSTGQETVLPSQNAEPVNKSRSAGQKKKRAGWVIGLTAAGIVLAGAALTGALLGGGLGADGIWLCESRGWVLSIEGETLTEYSPAGLTSAQVTYTGGSGEAQLREGGVRFTVIGNSLRLTETGTGDQYLFKRQGSDFAIADAVREGLEGDWSSEEKGEVLRLDGGVLSVFAHEGDQTGRYVYDIEKGEGVLWLGEKTYGFTAGWDTLAVGTRGEYARAEPELDVVAFVSEYANPLLTAWYETSGRYGSIEFKDDGTFTLTLYGEMLEGTYTYDRQAAIGMVMLGTTGEAEEFRYDDGTLTLDDKTYTPQYVEQPAAEDIYQEVAGRWHEDEHPEEQLVFRSDGTVDIIGAETLHTGTYRVDPFKKSGVIILSDGTKVEEYPFALGDDVLTLGGYSYRRQPTAAETGLILGTWYDQAGVKGTLYFDEDGFAIMNEKGAFFYGVYAFDMQTDIGSMTLEYAKGPLTWELVLREGLLHTGDVVYTQEIVAQEGHAEAQ